MQHGGKNLNEHMSGPAATHNDNMRMGCVQVAKGTYNVADPERFAHGEDIPDDAAESDTPNTEDPSQTKARVSRRVSTKSLA